MTFTDQTGRKVILKQKPTRIVSVVPSQTELLYDLGLGDKVIGITRFCIHPNEWFRSKTRVGGTKQLNLDRIRQLEPDLVIANKEENVKEQIEELEKQFPVWVSDVNNLPDAYEMIKQIGLITGMEASSQILIDHIKEEFQQLHQSIGQAPAQNKKLSTAYLIWREPFMTIGGDTFIHAMIQEAGFENIFANKTRYPELNPEDIKKLNCDLIILSSEPFPFKEKHIEELKTLGYKGKAILVDGEMFSWYGSRLTRAPAYFLELRSKLGIEF
jgi:ABC-type Fe3+-hydroxamate transport system substrate-binding protein